MNTLILTLTAREPLVITDGSAESMAHQTLHHIPGNMLLGAFASAWIAAHPKDIPDDSPEFRALFLDGRVEWGSACPLVADRPTVPVPLCLVQEKTGRACRVKVVQRAKAARKSATCCTAIRKRGQAPNAKS